MSVLVVTPPAQIVDLELAKSHLRVTDGDEDELIEVYCQAAQASIDGPFGWLGRCLGRQTLELRTNTFSGCEALPYGAVLSILSIKYVDVTGIEQTLDDDDFIAVDGFLYPAPGRSWPQVRGDAEGVRVRYEAGFETVPVSITQALLLLISHWFRNRSAVVTGTIVSDLPHGVTALLSPFRKFG